MAASLVLFKTTIETHDLHLHRHTHFLYQNQLTYLMKKLLLSPLYLLKQQDLLLNQFCLAHMSNLRQVHLFNNIQTVFLKIISLVMECWGVFTGHNFLRERYLHEFCEPPIIHRNFKSANILLDDDLSVRVSDCGLAPIITRGSVSQLSGHLRSTFGYGAPEFESGIYTSMSDVYSFGVAMLELLTGRMSYDSTRHRGEQLLVRWAVSQLHDIDALSSMADPSLNGEYPVKSLSNFADIISRCVQGEPEFRPPMSEAVQDLIQMIRREASVRSDRN